MHLLSALVVSSTLVGFNAVRFRVTVFGMSRWTLRPVGLSILVGLLALIVLILVLPEVDLPDTALRGGTAPIDIHSRVTSAPLLVSITLSTPFGLSTHPASRRFDRSPSSTHTTSSFLPLLHRSLRC